MEDVSKNPYLTDVGISGLIANLIDEGHQYTFLSKLNDQRLEAIARQAENVCGEIPSYLQSLGAVVAFAADTGELSSKEIRDTAWLTAFLGEVVEAVSEIHANARGTIDSRGPKAA